MSCRPSRCRRRRRETRGDSARFGYRSVPDSGWPWLIHPSPVGSLLRRVLPGRMQPGSCRRERELAGSHGAWFSTVSVRPKAAPMASKTIKTIKNAKPRPRECCAKRSWSSAAELNSQAARPRPGATPSASDRSLQVAVACLLAQAAENVAIVQVRLLNGSFRTIINSREVRLGCATIEN